LVQASQKIGTSFFLKSLGMLAVSGFQRFDKNPRLYIYYIDTKKQKRTTQVDGQLENLLRKPWAKAVENASRLRAALTALTHFFNLPTTATSSRKFGHRGIQQDAASRYR
jgi:hypothetical protein